nr:MULTISPECIES: DUF645 family protein [Vibrio]
MLTSELLALDVCLLDAFA